MNTESPAIDPERLRKLLEGELSEEEQSDLLAKLEECPAHRKSLEQVAATPELWEKAADLLSTLPPGDSPTERQGKGSSDSELSFLRPSRHPDCMGELGHYRVLKRVGSGGMGIVLQAVDPVLNRVVAIKVLRLTLAEQSLARKRFLREARAAAAVSHEHVVRIYAVEEDRGVPYIVTEFISGITLQQNIEKNAPLELREILRIGRQMAAGLAAAHRQGLVHRDIKPANVLLENGIQCVKITDFGLARSSEFTSLTLSGTISGTPEYMAPEQVRDANVDYRADLFSLGSVLYTMCTGKSPFRKRELVATIGAVAEQEPKPITELNPEIPYWLIQLIEQLHAKQPEKRPQSADEVERRLAAGLSELQDPASVRSAGPSQNAGAWRRRAPAVAAAMLGTLVLAVPLAYLGSALSRPGTENGHSPAVPDRPSAPTRQDTLVVEGVGIENVTIGASIKEILEALGPPDWRVNEPHVWLVYRDTRGIDIVFSGGTATEIRFNPGFPHALKRGPSIGSSLEEVVEAYGAPRRVVEAAEAGFEDRVLYQLPRASNIVYQSEGVLFWFDSNEKVSQFVVFSKRPRRITPRIAPGAEGTKNTRPVWRFHSA